MRFIDLFAGLGGFHVALHGQGHQCVFASEIDGKLADLYEKNFGILPAGDLRECWQSVPDHDVLCAGFPCQPFSKAGPQRGFACPESGDLFEYIARIIGVRGPRYVIMENVPNIRKHDNGRTWAQINARLSGLGYVVKAKELSPHHIGIPQLRPRVFLVAAKSLDHFDWPSPVQSSTHISSILQNSPDNALRLGERYQRYLDAWEEFLRLIPSSAKLPSFPLWAMEFDATYPIDGSGPLAQEEADLHRLKGAFGQSLAGAPISSIEKLLPPYARKHDPLPKWKVAFIKQNRKFFGEHRNVLANWITQIRDFPPSFQKLEWNTQTGARTLKDKILQFRASGIRVKDPEYAPSLVALTTSQVPVLGWQRRYMSIEECARLQCLDGLSYLPVNPNDAYKALGNAVNSAVISTISKSLFGEETDRMLLRDRAA